MRSATTFSSDKRFLYHLHAVSAVENDDSPSLSNAQVLPIRITRLTVARVSCRVVIAVALSKSVWRRSWRKGRAPNVIPRHSHQSIQRRSSSRRSRGGADDFRARARDLAFLLAINWPALLFDRACDLVFTR